MKAHPEKTLLLCLLALMLGSCASPQGGNATVTPSPAAPEGTVTLNVFAAASLTDAFSEIAKLFEAENPGVSVAFNFAGSQQLAQQIVEGAQADVFTSANQRQMQIAIEAGSVLSGTQQVFARNRLVVIYPQDNPAGIASLADLAKPGLKLVFAAEEVPVGQYTREFLEKAAADPNLGAAYSEAVLNNVVSFEDSVRAVLTKVVLGEAD